MFAVLACGISTGPVAPRCLAVDRPSASHEQDGLILLVDDEHVLYRPGTKRVLHPVSRSPANPMLLDSQPWEETIGYCSVHRDAVSGKYQLWYQAYRRQGTHLCYATSDDGLRWTRPRLGIVELDGSKENNIVLADPDYGASVVYDAEATDPQRRYKFAYFKRGMAIAFSPDGVHWNVHARKAFDKYAGGKPGQPPFVGEGPAHYLPLTISDVIDVSRDPVRNCWMAYTKTWLDGPQGEMFWRRAVVRSDSPDFLNWSRPELVSWPDELDEFSTLARGRLRDGETAGGGSRGIHIHGGPTFYYGGVYFSLLQVIDSAHTGLMPTELAISRDGYHLSRPFRDTWFIPVDGGDAFDSGAIWTNATPVFTADEIRFYYGAYSGNWKQGLIQKPTGVGLATIPRDRFAGLTPIGERGQVTLTPASWKALESLSINADCNAGSVRAEVLDGHGFRIRGFTRDDVEPIRGDSLRHVAGWKQSRLADLPPGAYALRLHLEGDAVLYAVNFSGTADQR